MTASPRLAPRDRALPPVFVLGGHQTDFARNITREGKGLFDLVGEAATRALEATGAEAREVEVGHVGSFIPELYTGQSHLGGLLAEAHPDLAGIPITRHEAACASGGVAVLAAMADLQAGRYDVALVLGVELMRAQSGFESQQKLGAAAWVPRETTGVAYPWPELFSHVAEEYDRRYGLRREHLAALARNNYENARRNPNAQTRTWTLSEGAFAEDDKENPVIAGRTRRYDASPVTDGAACVVLASADYAAAWARRRGVPIESVARIEGYGHRTARMGMKDKLEASRGEPYVFPHVRGAVLDAFARARIEGPSALSAVEAHDCFTISHYMGIDHFGIAPPGEPFRAIEDGTVLRGGKLPVNPGGGLMGIGHPVGATGVRMLLDAQKQVTGAAGENQVPGAKRVAMLNIGGSATTAVVLVIGRA
ncbi:acetyl-CoA acetyltransferase [Polyangium sorediatum]|uniref:Acetyl-CoA acetyltransferase n=1 Tax=Polyangium sorediatum TaxID=889274 RepID=A0ABT6P4P7_9BACT|nr:acetyl-CoA acetyltransferase [Polyangium sorediatum]MDI1435496.1 acetyl-CoA acetyltransferase [Polyangium sorediatum]